MLRSVTGGSTIIIRVSGGSSPPPATRALPSWGFAASASLEARAGAARLRGSLDLAEQSRQVDGLGIEIRAADLDALGAIARQRVRGQRDDGDRSGCRGGLDQLRRFPAVHWAECYVHQYQVG